MILVHVMVDSRKLFLMLPLLNLVILNLFGILSVRMVVQKVIIFRGLVDGKSLSR